MVPMSGVENDEALDDERRDPSILAVVGVAATVPGVGAFTKLVAVTAVDGSGKSSSRDSLTLVIMGCCLFLSHGFFFGGEASLRLLRSAPTPPNVAMMVVVGFVSFFAVEFQLLPSRDDRFILWFVLPMYLLIIQHAQHWLSSSSRDWRRTLQLFARFKK